MGVFVASVSRLFRQEGDAAQHSWASVDAYLADSRASAGLLSMSLRGANEILHRAEPVAVDALLAALLPHSENAMTVLAEMASQFPDFDTLTDKLIAPVARLSGELWVDDRLDFSEVTLVSSRLHLLINRFPTTGKGPIANAPSLFLVGLPNAQHTLGLRVMIRRFREAGWRVETSPDQTLSEAAFSLLKQGGYDAVGISVATDDQNTRLARITERLRKMHGNSQAPKIILGGAGLLGTSEEASKLNVELTLGPNADPIKSMGELLGFQQ
jgi:methylmalonyl-CoA mutase cobalamin-binding subunit